MPGFTPEDLAGVFSALEAAGWDAVLVGGQAVNLWAHHYGTDLPAWRALQPYTSRDLDYHGGLAEARLAMRVLRARGRLNTAHEPAPNAAVLTVSMPDGQELIVDILTGVFGVSAAEIDRTSVDLSGSGALRGLKLRVIHPLLLMEGKVASLCGLDQVHRQDSKHLKLLTLVFQEWVRERLDDPRAVLRAVERLAACAASPDGVSTFARGIDLMQAVPWEDLRGSQAYAEFFQRRLPQLMERTTIRRQRYLDVSEDRGPSR